MRGRIMAQLKFSFSLVMANEGAYANDPDDTGGETYKGISRNNFPASEIWPRIDAIKKRVGPNVTKINSEASSDVALQNMVVSFYDRFFWKPLNLDNIKDQKLATELFDTGVNMGVGVAASFLQQALNINNNDGRTYQDVPETANVGPLTTKLCNEHPRPNELFKTLNVLQGARYISICRNNPKMEKFWRSWLSRVTTSY